MPVALDSYSFWMGGYGLMYLSDNTVDVHVYAKQYTIHTKVLELDFLACLSVRGVYMYVHKTAHTHVLIFQVHHRCASPCMYLTSLMC